MRLWTDAEKKTDAVKLAIKVRKQNKKAFPLLLSHIDKKKSKAGQEAHHVVKKFIDKKKKCKGGHFEGAWQALEELHEDKDVMSKAEAQQRCYSCKMSETERPAVFLVKMEELKQKLCNDHSHDILDEEFLQDALNGLPSSEEEGKLGPWQIARQHIERDMKQDKSHNLSKLTKELKKVHEEPHPDADEEVDTDEEDNTKSGEALMAAHGKKFKLLCRKCGKQGHKAVDCWSGKKDSGRKTRDNGCKGRSSKESFSRKCFHCGKKGHQKSDCHELKKDKEEQGNVVGDALFMAVDLDALQCCVEIEVDGEAIADDNNIRDDFFDSFETEDATNDDGCWTEEMGMPPPLMEKLLTGTTHLSIAEVQEMECQFARDALLKAIQVSTPRDATSDDEASDDENCCSCLSEGGEGDEECPIALVTKNDLAVCNSEVCSHRYPSEDCKTCLNGKGTTAMPFECTSAKQSKIAKPKTTSDTCRVCKLPGHLGKHCVAKI